MSALFVTLDPSIFIYVTKLPSPDHIRAFVYHLNAVLSCGLNVLTLILLDMFKTLKLEILGFVCVNVYNVLLVVSSEFKWWNVAMVVYQLLGDNAV